MSERPLQLLTLPFDVLTALLKSLDSFSDLLSLIRANSTFYNVWRANTQGVSRQISLRQFAPWTDAVAALRAIDGKKSDEKGEDEKQTSREPPLFTFRGESLSAGDVKRMIKGAGQITGIVNRNRLRDFKFSLISARFETPTASERFRSDRALYRIAMYSQRMAKDPRGWRLPNCIDHDLAQLSVVELTEIQKAMQIFAQTFENLAFQADMGSQIGTKICMAVSFAISKKLQNLWEDSACGVGKDKVRSLKKLLDRYALLDIAVGYEHEMDALEKKLSVS
ncbi:hypothetical protein L873DRAFT_1841900 [Choiromyces venosus 120613-1]|uniref:F-box domain-containing protein n=1 Tax=Choiromyces venosus 120613-1 TaxID=1336337 RepID=A0A3N4K8X3_9PEZI|nr:hypothetical protein L873DRAFT_1841900 [Choiromyces venosus 120613-1]